MLKKVSYLLLVLMLFVVVGCEEGIENSEEAQSAVDKQYIESGDVSGHLVPGETITFYVETTDSPEGDNMHENVGMGRIIVVVEGYARPE